jgi:streptogramin lyase
MVIGIIVVLTLALFAGVVNAQGGGTTVATGFNSPQGVLMDADGNVWVIDSGLGGETEISFPSPQTGMLEAAQVGDTARVVQVTPDGTQTVAASLPSLLIGMEAVGGARLAMLNGTLYATSGQWAGDPTSSPPLVNTPSVVKIAGGQATEVANTWPLESSQNPDGQIVGSHPYGLTAGPDGKLWVADAGANTLLKVDPATGTVEVVAAFDGLPGPLPNPARGDAMESDPVPTAVAFDQAGNAYVSFLPGFPFLPGSAKVVKVTSDGQVSDYATGLTMVTDLRTGPDGNMYAASLGEFGQQGPVPNSGAIIRIKEGDASEVVVSGLSFPTSLDFNTNGDAYVIVNGVGAPGSGEVVMFAGLTAMPGSPLPESAPATLPESGGEQSGQSESAIVLLVLGLGLGIAGFALKRRGLGFR